MTRKGWKAIKRKKIPLLSEKQRKARLRFAKKYAKLTAEDWDNFLFTNSVLNIFSSTLIQKAISYGARRNVMFLQLAK